MVAYTGGTLSEGVPPIFNMANIKMINVLLWAGSFTCLAGSGVALIADTSHETLQVRDLLALFGAAISGLAGAVAYMFKQWQKRDELWLKSVVSSVEANLGVSRSLENMARQIEIMAGKIADMSSELRHLK